MKKSLLIILFIILLSGASLRIYNLGTESLWSDEPHSIVSAKQNSIRAIIDSVNVHEYHCPPFYYILLHYWIKYTGDNEFTLRLFSAIFGIFSIGIIFLIGKEIFNPQVGLISSLIFSLSIMEILYSQEIRTYAFFSFLVLISVYFFIKILKENKIRHYLLYFLSTLAMIYTLPFGFVVLFFQNIFIIFSYDKYKKLIKSWFFGQLFLFLFFIPEIPTFLKMFKKNYVLNFIVLVEKYSTPNILKNTLFTSLLLIFIFIVFVVLLFYFREQIKSFIKNFKFKKYDYLFLFFLILVGIIYFYLTPLLIRPIFLTRYSLFLMPFFYIIIAAGISKFNKPLKILVILALILLSIYPLSIYYPETTKEDWRSASSYVERYSQKDDIVLLCSWGLPFKYYFSKDNQIISAKQYEEISKVQEKLKNKNYWLVFSPEHKKGKICEELLANNIPKITQSYKRMEVLYFTN